MSTFGRDKLFTLMLMVTVLLTLLFAGLVAADLENAHKTVTTALAGPGQPLAAAQATATPAAGGATAAPGAQGSTVTHSSGGGGTTAGGGHAGPSGVPNAGVHGGVIRIGDITTQTGPGRSTPMAHSVAAWAKWVDAHGGINGYTIQLDLRDDAGNPDTGGSYYRDFASGPEAVFAMVGECAPVTDEQETGFINANHVIMVGECQEPADAYNSPYIWLSGPNPFQNGQLGAKLMVALQHWPAPGGRVALVCLNDPSTQKVCDGAAAYYGSGRLWNGAPQEEAIYDNNYQQLITQWCSASPPVTDVHLVLEPGSTQRYLYAAQNQSCNGHAWNPPTFENLVIDDGIAHYPNAAGMMIGTPFTPLDQNTAGMQRLVTTYQTYYPDEHVDLYSEVSWSYCMIFEHALQLMGGNVTKQNLIDTLDALHNWDTTIGPVVSYSPGTQHVGDVENALMKLQNPGDSWQLVTVHGPITLS